MLSRGILERLLTAGNGFRQTVLRDAVSSGYAWLASQRRKSPLTRPTGSSRRCHHRRWSVKAQHPDKRWNGKIREGGLLDEETGAVPGRTILMHTGQRSKSEFTSSAARQRAGRPKVDVPNSRKTGSLLLKDLRHLLRWLTYEP